MTESVLRPKPEPPPDLWAQMDAELQAEAQKLKDTTERIPAGVFSVSDFAKHNHIALRTAREQVADLREQGRIRVYLWTHTSHGRTPYYTLAEVVAGQASLVGLGHVRATKRFVGR